MSAKTTALCPCQSSLSYEDCCGRFHSGNMFPETAEQLMRSRYSAFVLKNIPYIVQTTVPSQQTLLDEKALQDWADETQWLDLDIVKAETLTKIEAALISATSESPFTRDWAGKPMLGGIRFPSTNTKCG